MSHGFWWSVLVELVGRVSPSGFLCLLLRFVFVDVYIQKVPILLAFAVIKIMYSARLPGASFFECFSLF